VTASSSSSFKFLLQQQQQQQQQSTKVVVRCKSTIPADSSAASNTTTTTTASITKGITGAAESTSSSHSSSSSNSTSMHGIVASLLAAAAGVVTVSTVANMVERMTSSIVPPFAVQQQRYDTTQYTGRCCHMLLQCDPYLLRYTHAQIHRAKAFVDQHVQQQEHEQKDEQEQQYYLHNGSLDRTATTTTTTPPPATTDPTDRALHRELWEAKRIYESAMNDSGEIIPMPFRMSGYVPFNGPICVAMVSSTTTAAILFWSWINQSQNALVNYYNRSNSSSTMDTSTIVQSYSIAVASALIVAFGLATWIQKRYPQPATAQRLLRYVAFPSAVIASSLNCYIVRAPEIQTGIPLLNEDGQDVYAIDRSSPTTTNMSTADVMTVFHDDGTNSSATNTSSSSSSSSTKDPPTTTMTTTTSSIAAARGVYATTASRALLQAPVYFVPPVLVGTIFHAYVQQFPYRTLPLTTFLLLCSFGLGLPAAVAIFPQRSSISAQHVESHFQQLINPKTQQPYTIFYYDKGL
jgi:sideroflexin-5